MLEWVREVTKVLHPNTPFGEPDVSMSYGNTDGLNKTIKIFSNEWQEGKDPIEDRQSIFVEEFTYTSAFQNFEPRGLNCVAVKTDNYGMLVDGPGGLRDLLENWKDHQKAQMPHLMYTIPIGQNPTGVVMNLERKKAVYDVCKEYDIVIIEDDPYWFLQYDRDSKPQRSSYLNSLVPSYLSLDTDGRVVRLDTFSKLVAPGCRLGWVTAQPDVINKFILFTESNMQGPSGIVQSLVAQLMAGAGNSSDSIDGDSRWATSGFIKWCEGLANSYEGRRNLMCDKLEKGKYIVQQDDDDYVHINQTQVFDFNRPAGGMFLWLHMLFDNHPKQGEFSKEQFSNALFVYLAQEEFKVVVCPGFVFGGTDEIRNGRAWEYYRVCFAAVDLEDIERFTEQFVLGVESFWHLSSERIEELLD